MVMSLKQKKVKFNPRMKLNHNTFNPSRRKKHFNVVHWSGPEDDSIFVRTHSYNKLNKIIFISWSDKFYCTLMIMIWTQKILLKIIMKQSWLTFVLTENKSEIISAIFFLFFKYCNHTFICLWQVNYLITITKLLVTQSF